MSFTTTPLLRPSYRLCPRARKPRSSRPRGRWRSCAVSSSIEHGTFIDDAAIALFKERGAFLVPTLYVWEFFLVEEADSAAQKKMVELVMLGGRIIRQD